MKDEISRRDYLKTIGALGAATSTAGCSVIGDIFRPEAPALEEAVAQTEQSLKNEIPWNDYALNFQVSDLELELDNLGPTGVEEANRYSLGLSIDLSGDSNDLSGWMANSERRAEFIRLYAAPTYDMLLETYDNLQDFTVPNQPSHRNQLVEYTTEVGAEDCSYIADEIAATRLEGILESPTAYLEYLNNGEVLTIELDNGRFGFGYLC